MPLKIVRKKHYTTTVIKVCMLLCALFPNDHQILSSRKIPNLYPNINTVYVHIYEFERLVNIKSNLIQSLYNIRYLS